MAAFQVSTEAEDDLLIPKRGQNRLEVGALGRRCGLEIVAEVLLQPFLLCWMTASPMA